MSEAPRFSTNYNELKDHLKVLTVVDLQQIEAKAKILDFADCLTWLGLDLEDLNELEAKWALKAHSRGALEAVHKATEHLFANMKTRNGAQACLEYLKAKSGDFKIDATPAPGKGSGFSFNVTMHEEKEESQRPKLVKAG